MKTYLILLTIAIVAVLLGLFWEVWKDTKRNNRP